MHRHVVILLMSLPTGIYKTFYNILWASAVKIKSHPNYIINSLSDFFSRNVKTMADWKEIDDDRDNTNAIMNYNVTKMVSFIQTTKLNNKFSFTFTSAHSTVVNFIVPAHKTRHSYLSCRSIEFTEYLQKIDSTPRHISRLFEIDLNIVLVFWRV